MAESDTIAAWVVDDTEHHQVLDEFVSTREAVDRQIDQSSLCLTRVRHPFRRRSDRG